MRWYSSMLGSPVGGAFLWITLNFRRRDSAVRPAAGNSSSCRAESCSQSSPEMGRRSAAQLTRWVISASEKPFPRLLEGAMIENGTCLALEVDEKEIDEKGCEEEQWFGAEGGGWVAMMRIM